MGLLQAVVMALVALVLAPGLEFYFDVTPKVVVLLAGTATLLLWHARRPTPSGSGDSVTQRGFGIVIVCNAVSLMVSAMLSRNQALSWFGTSWRRFGVVEECAILLFAWLMTRHNAGRPDR